MPQHNFEEARIDAVLDRRYRLRREIARGGMGCVFEAEHVVTRARVAIKTLVRSTLDQPAFHTRLMREARVLGALRHPSIVAVHDAGTCDKYGPYIALEMIDGRPLDGILLTRQTLPVGQTVAIAIQLCSALESVHRSGIVHRDIKPSNILIARTLIGDQVELIDFGVAKLGPEDEVVADKLTKAGELLGTVEYMSPEQIMGTHVVDARTDIYGVGIAVYECLTGEVPYSGNPIAVIANMLAGTRPSPIRGRRNDVTLELEAVVRKALELDPERRFASARELAGALLTSIGGLAPPIDLLESLPDQASVEEQEAAALRARREMTPTVSEINRRRQFARAPYVTPVRLLLEDGGTCDGRTEDISEGGVLIVTDSECAENQKVRIRIPLPASGRLVVLPAITKWIKTRKNQRAIGVEFEDAPEDVRAEIRAYAAFMAGAPAKS